VGKRKKKAQSNDGSKERARLFLRFLLKAGSIEEAF
jgi:hypothetical protein